MGFYEDTQFLTKPINNAHALDIRPDTECWGGLDIRPDTDFLPNGNFSTAARQRDDCQPTAMSCIGEASVPHMRQLSGQGLQAQTASMGSHATADKGAEGWVEASGESLP